MSCLQNFTYNILERIETVIFPSECRSWGIISLTIAYFWQLYTLWILVQLHEVVPGKRYNRYVELAQAAFGERLGVWLALFPTVYLSAGTATALILVGGETMKMFFQIVCGPLCSSNPSSLISLMSSVAGIVL
ncbi:lysine histidine transporter-like 8 [Lycium barbarum]|uniref:lysine histidine transporter-like 8 n=1 Tax=Lycium barbarum TaxID=112863 RepID=UPI00293EB41B|nr:lysine histidine transporter-like 8 [Lycium barbarum]